MAESRPSAEHEQADGLKVPDLEGRELEKLTDLVYKLMKEELLLARERRGMTQGMERR